ncbi:MAG: DNA repair protein RecN [Bacillota bacterium]|nr:DNA repair protein RecN [Bacillota bacterium]
MLQLVEIRDFALIEELAFEAQAGLTCLTGETGAGKSLLVDAIAQACGAPADRGLVRTGCDQALVSCLFSVNGPVRKRLELEEETSEIVLSRQLQAAGRSRARINGQLVPQQLLRETGGLLVDIYGQHEQQALFDAGRHLGILDASGGGRLAAALEHYGESHTALLRLAAEERSLGGSAAERERRMDMLGFQLEEIRAARLREGEEELLIARRARLLEARRLESALETALEALGFAADDGVAERETAIRGLERAADALGSLASLGGDWPRLYGEFGLLLERLSELGSELLTRYENLEADERLLERIDQRLDRLTRLKRKYGDSITEILGFEAAAADELERLAQHEERSAALGREREALGRERLARAQKLHQERRLAADRLEREIASELGSLGFPHARFLVDFAPLPESPDDERFGPEGCDRVEFLFSANPGEEPRPLARIASGGEAARIMLALRLVLDDGGEPRLMIFDEVDSGVGGETARLVGEKLARLARGRQVMCVTHQAQVAAFADHHYRISKRVEGSRTRTLLEKLDADARVTELARLLAGDADPERSRALARSLLEESRSG